MNNIQSFDVWGKDFQNRVVKSVLTDNEFFDNVFESIKTEYFGKQSHQLIWDQIIKHFNGYKNVPTLENIEVEFAHLSDKDLKKEIMTTLKEINAVKENVTLQQTKEKTIQFCKFKSLENAMLKSVDKMLDGDFEEIQILIEDALNVGANTDRGHDFFKSFKERLNSPQRKTITSGFPILDSIKIMDGGLGEGELGVVISPTGGGKSFFLVNIGYGVLLEGKNVVHYTFELSESNIGARYDARITDIPIKEIRNNKVKAEKIIKSFDGGCLIIKEYPTKFANVNTIRFHYNKLCNIGMKPDVIIIDYADLMRSRKGYDSKFYELESIYEDLRGLAMEYKVPIWTACQTNRSGVNDEIISLDKISESYAKAMIADFIVTCSRTMEDKENGGGKIFIAKNRAGDDGVVFSMKIDLARAKMEIVERMSSQQLNGTNTAPISGATLKNLWSKHQNGASSSQTGT